MELLGYDFKDRSLLEEALTTPSVKMDHPSVRDNQRLEFLGDAVLGFLSARRLYAEHGDDEEGALTVRRTHMVSTAALCAAADRHGLVPQLIRNRHSRPLPKNAKVIADAIEAIIGAAYLDGGMSAAEKVFLTLGLTAAADNAALAANPKGELQILAQAMKPPHRPVYRLVHTSGRAHEPVFTVEVAVDDVGTAVASARSHKEAEAAAAAELLAMIKKRGIGK